MKKYLWVQFWYPVKAIRRCNGNFAAHTLMRNCYFSGFGVRTIGQGIKIDAC